MVPLASFDELSGGFYEDFMQETIVTPKGTILPLLLMPRKHKDKNTGQWIETIKAYLQVAQRLVWFREDHPDWSIKTQMLERSPEHALFKAEIYDEKSNLISTAHKQEQVQHWADFIEKAETGSVGRALANCGYGTQFAPELDEGDRLADSPTEPKRKKELPAPALDTKESLPDFGSPNNDKTDSKGNSSNENEIGNTKFPEGSKHSGLTFRQLMVRDLKAASELAKYWKGQKEKGQDLKGYIPKYLEFATKHNLFNFDIVK